MLLIPLATRSVEVLASEAQVGPSIIGLDHIPVAVRDLDRASEHYRALGFTLKPGRMHTDGIRNNHVKFKDGSGIELISPPAIPVDQLTSGYLSRITEGDGPVFLSFHARDTNKLSAALRAASIHFRQGDVITLADPRLNFVLFDQDNRSPTDRPEHFAHPNTAVAMKSVWLALDESTRQSLTNVLLALGAVRSSKTVFVPSATMADVWDVQNARIVLLPSSRQLVPGRPIIGVEFEVRDLAAAAEYLGRRASSFSGRSEMSDEKRVFVAPADAHGLWLAFHHD
ncbi:MAG TPA: VOC family protein [Pseudolabrys sp.]|jgi:catechol 2,3-dioxygenase-like lactoylglutathione lyase family enzyme|nr:VOC family protein [Pseudolabrys sp.]